MRENIRTSIGAACLSLLATAATVLVAGRPALADCGRGFLSDIRHGAAVCVHASERPPAGVDLEERPSPDDLKERRFGETKAPPRIASTVPGTVASSPGGTVACIGDGSTGDRVQAVYAHASDIADRFDSVAPMIRQYAADADYQINISAGQSGAGRRVRYITATCGLDIARVTLSPTGDDSFSAMRSELRAQGFSRTDRKYLVWVDAAVGICGLGELYLDDRPTADNLNNGGPSFARVDSPCWGYAETHELLHMLGGVQDSAPHSTGAGHCTDENDTMCYVDTSGGSLSTDCPSFPAWQVDCGLDDYFNGAPPASSYLATHWNVASSSFLEPALAPPAPPSISLSAPASLAAGGTMTLTASVGVPADRTYMVGWASSRPDCTFSAASGATNLFTCAATAAGSGLITASVVDSAGMSSSASRTYTLAVPSRRRATTLSLGASASRVRRGGRATLTAKFRDAATRAPVYGMPVTIYARSAGSSRWTRIAVRSTGPSGTFTFVVQPTRTTYYLLVSAYTSTWASSRSASKRISVS